MPPVAAGAVIVKLPRLLPATATTDGAPGATGVIAKVCDTCGAGAKPDPPAWLALIVQFPAETIVIFKLFAGVIVQTLAVAEVSVTGSAELAVAPDAIVPPATNGVDAGCANVIVCGLPTTFNVNDWVKLPLALIALIVYGPNVPIAGAVPERTPVAELSVTVPGSVGPAVIE